MSGNYDRKVATMKNSTLKNSGLNWTDDEGYCGYPTARVNGFAIVMCCDDDDSLAIQVFDEEDDHAIECGEIYQQLSGFDSFDEMVHNAEHLAFALFRARF